MFALSLQSGSSGNCIYVEANGTRLLVDAGITGIQAERRLAIHGVDIRRVDALLVSHDHADHIRSAGIFHRKYGVPVHATAGTLAAARNRHRLGRLGEVVHFRPGEVFRVGGLTVESLPTPHDGTDGVAFVIDDGRRRLGVLTDLGHVFDRLRTAVESLDGVFIESNYDPGLLESGPYPPPLQERIRGRGGHLSNVEAAELIRDHGRRLRWAFLSHLSGENNTPAIAEATFRRIAGERIPLFVASRTDVSGPVRL